MPDFEAADSKYSDFGGFSNPLLSYTNASVTVALGASVGNGDITIQCLDSFKIHDRINGYQILFSDGAQGTGVVITSNMVQNTDSSRVSTDFLFSPLHTIPKYDSTGYYKSTEQSKGKIHASCPLSEPTEMLPEVSPQNQFVSSSFFLLSVSLTVCVSV